jgi:hypothetical protein
MRAVRFTRKVKSVERKLLGAMEEFTSGMAQTDDITFVLVEKRAATEA